MNPDDLIFHKATQEDLISLQAIAQNTFLEAFADLNTKEDMDQYIHEKLSIEQLAQEMATQGSEFHLLNLHEQTIGYLKVNFGDAQNEPFGQNALEIERIYLLNAYQGMGLGKFLFNHALAIARHQNVLFIWLGVWEKNQKAIRFYEKLGFKTFGKHSFLLGSDLQMDLLMKLTLS